MLRELQFAMIGFSLGALLVSVLYLPYAQGSTVTAYCCLPVLLLAIALEGKSKR